VPVNCAKLLEAKSVTARKLNRTAVFERRIVVDVFISVGPECRLAIADWRVLRKAEGERELSIAEWRLTNDERKEERRDVVFIGYTRLGGARSRRCSRRELEK